MISVSEIFKYCGSEGVPDVATSLANQNVCGDISIPVFEGVYLKIIPNGNIGFLCSSLREAGILQNLGRVCGTVGIALNVLDIDLLTLMGCVCAYTPRSGAHVFFKNNIPDLTHLTEEVAGDLAGLAAIPFDPIGVGPEFILDIANQALEILFNKLVGVLETDFSTCGINMHTWDELSEFYAELVNTGEMEWMRKVRRVYQLPTI